MRKYQVTLVSIAIGYRHRVARDSESASGQAMMMKNARALAAGTIIYRSGGKLYLLEDKKMANGGMMFAEMQSWTDDRLLAGAAGR
jgi:hypothetical protein